MARVFRHQYSDLDPKTGKRRVSKKWYIEYTDADGKRRRVVGYLDRRATDAKATELEREAELIRSGLRPRQTLHGKLGLTDLLDKFERAIVARGSSARHAARTRLYCEKIFAGLEWSVASDIDADAVQQWLGDYHQPGVKGHGANTVVHYGRAVISFGRWLAPKYLPVDPFGRSIQLPSIDADRRHVRRVLTAEEFARFLAAARAGRPLLGLTGASRAMLYETAAKTGFRARELAQLTPEMFHLDGDTPTIEVSGAITKNGLPDSQPLPVDLAARLAPMIAATPPGGRVWPGNWKPLDQDRCSDSVRMVRTDLRSAGIPYRDASGKAYDFHALRAQFGTDLARAGVPLQLAMRLMRHGNPAMTAKHYTLSDGKDKAEAVEKIAGPNTRKHTPEETLIFFGCLWWFLWCPKRL